MADRRIFLNSGTHKADVPLETHDKSFTNHLTARFGRAIPCFVDEVCENSYVHINPNMAFDLMPLVFPLQSKITAHVSYFSVATRNLWKNYQDFRVGVGNHVEPYISRTENWAKTGNLADYLGVPTTKVISREFDDYSNGQFYYFDYSYLESLGTGSPFVFSSLFSNVFSSRSRTASEKVCISFVSGIIKNLIKAGEDGRISFLFETPYQVGSASFGSVSRLAVVAHRSNLIGEEETYVYSTISDTFDYQSRLRNGVYSNAILYTVTQEQLQWFNKLLNDGYEVQLVAFLYTSNNNLSNPYYVKPNITGELAPAGDTGKTDVTLSMQGRMNDALPNKFQFHSMEYTHAAPSVNYFEGLEPVIPIRSAPFRAYQFIGNYFFRNRQIDPFKINGVEQANNFISTHEDGADMMTPVDFFKVPYEYDIFTTALLNPQLGNAPLVGVTTNQTDLDEAIGNVRFVPLVNGQYDYENAYDAGVIFNPQNGSITGISNYQDIADKPNIKRLSELITAGISINDLRNVSAFQRYLEKMQRTASQYENFVQEFYGVTPPTGENYPVYIGGFDRQISVGKILNQSASVNAQGQNVPLGMYAGVGAYRQDNDNLPNIRCFCAEDSWIIGLVWFSVTPIYSQMLPKYLTRRDKLDYFNPIFNGIGPQPILKKEIAPLQCSVEELDEVFGYQRPWYEYIMRLDEAHGAFRSSMANYLLQRQFLTPPDLSPDFIYINSEELSDVFSYQLDDDKIFGSMYFDYKVACPVARRSTPKIMV